MFAEQQVLKKLPEFAGRGKLIARVMQRREKGIEKYGCSVDEATDAGGELLDEEAWLNHALDELLDASIYLEMAGKTCPFPKWQERWRLIQRTTLMHVIDVHQAIQLLEADQAVSTDSK